MVRETSIATYHEIEENGLLSGRRFETYKALFEHGPCTGMELLRKMREAGTAPRIDSQIRARLNELRERGVAQELGTRVCTVTGYNVILWDVTKNLPLKLEKKKREKCNYCKGRGYVETQQGKLF